MRQTGKGWQTDMGRYGWKTTLADAEGFRARFEERGI